MEQMIHRFYSDPIARPPFPGQPTAAGGPSRRMNSSNPARAPHLSGSCSAPGSVHRSQGRRIVALLGSLCLAATSGCVWLKEGNKKLDLGVDPIAGAQAKSAAYRDTIGALTYFDGLRPMRVRGYGLVVGLGRNGSKDCPRHIYDRLIESLYKQQRGTGSVVGVSTLTPEQLVNDLDTAVVIVEGEIPPGAMSGDAFDVVVSAFPGTETQSLRGGRLFTTDLHVFRPVSDTVSITGQILARASGPVFVNPFMDEDVPTQGDPLTGIVLGGGRVSETRRLRLVLIEPSYARAQQIQDRINAYFPAASRAADAVSPSFVQVRVPQEYRGDTAHFLGLVRALYLSRDPRFEAAKARLLAEEIVRLDAPHSLIALALEGIGRAALPVLDDLYAHPNADVSFHAAAAGLRLNDHLAGDAMAAHARDAKGRHRLAAVRALAEAKGMAGAAMTLRQLLYDDDTRVRIAAYEGLVSRGESLIRTTAVGGDVFLLDEAPASGTPFLYARRSGERRIALFGDSLSLHTPVFYRASDGSLTITAQDGDDHLTLIRVVVSAGAASEPVAVPFDVATLIRMLGERAGVDHEGKVIGLGLDYGAVVHALFRLCQDRTIDAEFILEPSGVTDLLSPPPDSGRPESEL